MPSQRKKRQRRMRRLRQGRVLEDQCVVTGKRNSGVRGVSAPNCERLRAAQRKAQAEVPEVTSDSEPHAPQAAEPKVTEENKRPEILAPEKNNEAAEEFRAPEFVRGPEEVGAPEEVCIAKESTGKVGALEEMIKDIKDDNKVAELPKVSEHLRDIATLENTSAETPDMITAPKVELELMPVPKKAAAQKMSTSEATAGPVPWREVSVREIEAPGTKTPNVSSLEAPDVTPSKPQEVTASLEPLVSPHSPPEVVPAPEVTESPKSATGEGKMVATEMVPLKLTADPDVSVLEIVKGPEDVNVDFISNQNVEPLVGTKVLDMTEPKMSCSEIKPPKFSACVDLDVTEPDVILAPEVEAQEMKDEVLCEGSVKVPSEEPAVQENTIDNAETQIKLQV